MPMNPSSAVSRRAALTVSAGILGFASAPASLRAADWTPAEKTNAKLVTDFCAAFAGHDLNKVMSFFADNGAYRMSEAQEPNKGRQAVQDRIGSFLNRVERFEILETLAKGPMVFNERIDHFTGGGLRSWHGVGVFFVKDGKIVEWNDYTIAIDRG
jgi:limonene-1,2-epoxide hydrolase